MSGQGLALAVHHLTTGAPDRALRALEGLPSDEALAPDAMLVRGRALLALERADEARHVAERALTSDSDVPELWSLLSDACRAQDDLPAAEHAVLTALRLQPDDAGLLADYARLLAADGQDAKAERVLQRASELDPGSPDVATARTYVALARGDDRAAQRAARQALAQAPESVPAQSLLGVTSLLRGDAGTAWRASRRAAGASIGDRELAGLAREARLQAHPLMAGMRVVTRFGQVQVWLFGVALMMLAGRVLPPALGGPVILLWLLFIVYTWTADPLLRAWARWRW